MRIASVDKKEGALASVCGNEQRIAQARMNVREGMRVFAVYLSDSSGWTPRNEALMEAVVKQARTIRPGV